MTTDNKESSDSDGDATADREEIAALARQYLTLWKDQCSKLAEDPTTAEALTRLYAMIGQQTAAIAPIFAAFGQGMTTAAQTPEAAGATSGGKSEGTSTDVAAGAPPAAASSDGGGVRLVDIDRRLAALEERMARLESDAPAADAPATEHDDKRP